MSRVSLSEPNTCAFACGHTLKIWMSAFKYFIKTERVAQAMRATTRAHFQGERDPEWRQLKLKHAWQLWTITDKDRLLTDATTYTQWLRLLQVRAIHEWHLLATDVQLMTSVWSLCSPCVCVAIVTTIWWVFSIEFILWLAVIQKRSCHYTIILCVQKVEIRAHKQREEFKRLKCHISMKFKCQEQLLLLF